MADVNQRRLKLNADVGEVRDRVFSNDEAQLIALLDEANIACGGHAGDDSTMRVTLQRCRDDGVAVTAHPSYPDVAGFGRSRMTISDAALRSSLVAQVMALSAVAAEVGVPVAGLKPHGALYHAVGDDPRVAAVIVDVIDDVEVRLGCRLPLVLFHRASTRAWLMAQHVVVRREVFADRGIGHDGQLIARGQPGAMLDAGAAAARTRTILNDNDGTHDADTLCVHGDGDDAVGVARAVRAILNGD